MTQSDSLPITVRHANQSDNVLLSEIGAETFADTFGSYNRPQDMESYLESSFSPDIQASELTDPLSIFLIVEVDTEPAGYAHLCEGTAPPAIGGSCPIEIVRFYARTRWIGRKVGASLMEACLREAEARGCNIIWLDVWEQNKRAIAFYEKWGFRQVGS